MTSFSTRTIMLMSSKLSKTVPRLKLRHFQRHDVDSIGICCDNQSANTSNNHNFFPNIRPPQHVKPARGKRTNPSTHNTPIRQEAQGHSK